MKQFFSRLLDFAIAKRQSNSKTDIDNSIKPVLKKVMNFSISITIIIILCMLFYFKKASWYIVFTTLSYTCAYFAGGIILGFIFGIPKKFQTKQTTTVQLDKDGKPLSVNDSNSPSYDDNTSLEEISDWITKIIIGLSLVQFQKIQKMLFDAASNISKSYDLPLALSQIKEPKLSFFAFSYALIILYSILGSIVGYLWTRLEFPGILKQKDDDIKVNKKGQALNETLKILNEDLVKNLDTSQNNSPTNNPEKANFAIVTDSTTISLFSRILATIPIGPNSDDPQKNRWGGISVLRNFILTADVVPDTTIPSLYKVKLKISTADGSPLQSNVAFILHDSFDPILRVIDPRENSEIFIELLAYEAFTVGAICNITSEIEYTRLELDLNLQQGFPKGFYWSK